MMNFLTQLAVLAIVLIILIIIIKSNQTLERIYMEEEEGKAAPVVEIEIPKVNFSNMKLPKWKLKKTENGEAEEEEPVEERQPSGEKKPVERSGGTVPVSMPSKWSVEILDDYGRCKETRRIPSFPFTIGRNEENDLVLDDLSVSSFHVSLQEETGKVKMVDEGSLNKIYVAGNLVTSLFLEDRMEIGLGNIRLRFLKEGKQSSPTICYAQNSLMEEWH